jgi:hypothetical protein
MSFRYAVAAILIMTSSAHAQAVAAGVGVRTCAQFGQSYKNNPETAETVYYNWALGRAFGMSSRKCKKCPFHRHNLHVLPKPMERLCCSAGSASRSAAAQRRRESLRRQGALGWVCAHDQLGGKTFCKIRWDQLLLLSAAYRASRHFSYLAARALYKLALAGS